MFYFTPFPTKQYKLTGRTASVNVTDITRRFTLKSFLENDKIIYDEYFVQDGEKPDDVAYDYYGDATMDWLIMLTNEIKDPYYEWPRSYEQFQGYIKQKYGSVETALTTVHHYEWIVAPSSEYTSNDETFIIPEKTLIIDYAKFVSLPATDRRTVYVYDHENNLNEYRRKIFLMDLHLLERIKELHPIIFEEGLFIR
jgi:hypothetical protein